jgi:signal transduction histidine kinase
LRRRRRLTVRARLTLLNTGLFAVCGAILVAVSYILVAQVQAPGQGPDRAGTTSTFGGVPVNFVALCQSQRVSVHPDAGVRAKCNAALQLQGAQHQRNLTLSHLLQYSLITVAGVIALAAILGWIASGRALRPVRLITGAARAASEHNLSARVAPTGPSDELRELAETFDEMLARLQAAFEGQKRFIANASHELRTPLAVIRTTVDVVTGNPHSTPADLHDMAADIRAAVDHAEQLIGVLLTLARNERGLIVHEQLDLATVSEDVLDSADLGDRRMHATLEPAVILGDPVLAEQLVRNLVDNAVRYNVTAGDIWLKTTTAAGHSRLTVANTGQVISRANADRIFQPFQRLTERTPKDGFGLGLTIVASIAEIHGGTVTAQPRSDGGLSVAVTIRSHTTTADETPERDLVPASDD